MEFRKISRNIKADSLQDFQAESPPPFPKRTSHFLISQPTFDLYFVHSLQLKQYYPAS